MKIEKEYLDEDEIRYILRAPEKNGFDLVVPFEDGKRLLFVRDDETGELCAFFQKGPKERCLFVRKVTDEGKKDGARIWLSNEKTAKATKNPSYITYAELVDAAGADLADEVRTRLALPQFTRQIGKVQERLDALKARNLPKTKKEEDKKMSGVVDYNGKGQEVKEPVRQRVKGDTPIQYNPVGFVDGAKPRVDKQLDAVVAKFLELRAKNGDNSKKLNEKQVETLASRAVREVVAAARNSDEKRVLSANISVLTKYAEGRLKGEKEKTAPAIKKERGVETIIGAVSHLLEDKDFSLKFTAKTGKFGETLYTLDGKGEYRLPLGDKIGTPDKKAGTRTVSLDDIKKVGEVYLKLGLIDAYSEAVVDYIMSSSLAKRKQSLTKEEREYVVGRVKETLQAKTVTMDNANVLSEDEKTRVEFASPEWVYRRDIEKVVTQLTKINNYDERVIAANTLAKEFLNKNKDLKKANGATREAALRQWRGYFVKEAQKQNPVFTTTLGAITPTPERVVTEEEKARNEQDARNIAGHLGNSDGTRKPKSLEELEKEQREREAAEKAAAEEREKKEKAEREREAKEKTKKDKRAKTKATVKRILKKPLTWIALAAVTALAATELTLGLWSKPDQTKEAKQQAKQLAGETKMEATVGEDFDLQNFKITDAKGREIVTSYNQKFSLVGHLRPAKQNYDEVEMETYFTELGARAALSVASKANLKGEDGKITVPFVTESGKTTRAEFASDLTKLGYSEEEISKATELYEDAFAKTYNENYDAKNFEKQQTPPDGGQDGPGGTQGQETKIDLKGETAKAIYESAIEKYDPNFDIENAIVDGENVYATGTGTMLDGTPVDLLYTLNISGLGTEAVDSEQELKDAVSALDARTIGNTRAVGAEYYLDTQQGHSSKTIDRYRNEVDSEYYIVSSESPEKVSSKGTPGTAIVAMKVDGENVEKVDCGVVYAPSDLMNRAGLIVVGLLKQEYGERYIPQTGVVYYQNSNEANAQAQAAEDNKNKNPDRVI